MTVPAPAIAPYVPFYASLQPYLSVAEYMASPNGVDVSQLVPGGTAGANAAALTSLLAKASSYADTICGQVLAATLDLQVGEYRLGRDGYVRVPLPFSPVIEVSAVQAGSQPGGLAALSDLSGVWIDRKVVRIPVAGAGGVSACAGGRVFLQVAYVNGYANTALAAPTAVGDAAITLKSTVGVFPGMPLTIADDQSGTTEQVIVAAGYVPGSSSVALLTPVTGAHVIGVAVSALPRAVKSAVEFLTSHLVKVRGAESLALSGVSGGPSKQQSSGDTEETDEYDEAVRLLAPFRRVI